MNLPLTETTYVADNANAATTTTISTVSASMLVGVMVATVVAAAGIVV